MNKTTWIIFGVVVVAILGGLVYLSSGNKLDVSSVKNDAIIKASDQSGAIGDRVMGDVKSPVRLIEYGDYQCPGCGDVHPVVKEVMKKYDDKIAFVFRNFPLSSMHPNARAAAAAAEAAGKLGKFWPMHDMLYENQSSWENLDIDERTGIFTSYATSLKLDAKKFKTAMASNEVNQKISFDTAVGKKYGVTGTPTFFLDGKQLDSESSGTVEGLSTAIDEALKAHNIELPKETK